MTVTEIMQKASDDGVILSVNGAGKLRIEGTKEPVEKWLPEIREHKKAIMAALTIRPVTPIPCTACMRLELIDIMGQPIAGCLYPATGEYPEGWRRLPEQLEKCIWN